MGAVRARLKTLEDATTLRRRILVAFERAERETDPAAPRRVTDFRHHRRRPTGVELAGTIADLAKDTLPQIFATSTPARRAWC